MRLFTSDNEKLKLYLKTVISYLITYLINNWFLDSCSEEILTWKHDTTVRVTFKRTKLGETAHTVERCNARNGVFGIFVQN